MEISAGCALVIHDIRSHRAFVTWLVSAGFTVMLVLLNAPSSRAQESLVQIDPAQTKIEFTLGSTLHAVHGTFALKNSTIRFDSSGGKISGVITVDAASGGSGNDGRDKRMHREILESAKFPEIIFMPAQIRGAVSPSGASKVEVSGQFRLHGQDHEVTLPVEVTAEGSALRISAHFTIPYVEWGLKNPSTFLLRASDKVEIEVHATGHLQDAQASR